MNKILITGDIHGKFNTIRELYSLYKDVYVNDNDTIILLGDFGANFFFNYQDYKFKKKLGTYNFNYFAIRGNHEQRPSICMAENPSEWHTEEFWGGRVYVENQFPYIKYAYDCPEVYYIPAEKSEPIKTLVLPGAYSVDKYYRLANNWSWFEYEQCNEQERLLGSELAKTQSWDLILSHTCPIFFEPTDSYKIKLDQSMVDKTTERWLGQIEYNTKYNLWCWGHYHINRIYPYSKEGNQLALFGDCFFDLYKYFCDNKKIENCFIVTDDHSHIDNLNTLYENKGELKC